MTRPEAVASVQLAELKPHPWGFDPFDDLAVVDYGDCWFDAHNPLTIKPIIVEHARTILASGANMLTFGGDHYFTWMWWKWRRATTRAKSPRWLWPTSPVTCCA